MNEGGSMSLSEARKFVAALIVAAAAAAVFVVNFDPSLTDAVIVLSGAVFGVIGVFAAKNHTYDDVQKAVVALQGAALSVVGYFAVVSPGTQGKIEALVAAGLGVYGVWRVPNDSPQ